VNLNFVKNYLKEYGEYRVSVKNQNALFVIGVQLWGRMLLPIFQLCGHSCHFTNLAPSNPVAWPHFSNFFSQT